MPIKPCHPIRWNNNSNKYWDKEFIELINQNICPYCKIPLKIKGIIKTCNCSFYLIGSPETLAYAQKSKKSLQHSYYYNQSSSIICIECGSTNTKKDTSRAEIICQCGLVIQGPPAYSNYKKISYENIREITSQ